MNLFETSPCFLCINTTGLNKHKNHIFLINIKHKKNIYSFYSKDNNSEKKIVEQAISFLSNKNIITYNGTSFDIDFLNRKSYEYGLHHFIDTQFDLFLFLKKYELFRNESLKLSHLSKKYCDMEYPSYLQLAKIYRQKKLDEVDFLTIGKKEITILEKLFQKIQEIVEKNCFSILFQDKIFRISFFRYAREKSKLRIYFLNLDKLNVLYASEFLSIKTDTNYFYIDTILKEGHNIKQQKVYFIHCPFKTEYLDNILPVIVDNQFLADNIYQYAKNILYYVKL